MRTYKRVRDEMGNVTNKVILRLDDGASIPTDLNNTDYQMFLVDVEEGALVEDADPVPPLSLGDQARIAIRAVNWQEKVDEIAAGRTIAAQIRNDATGIPNANTRTRLANLLDGLIDHVEENWVWWHKLMQVLSMTDEEG